MKKFLSMFAFVATIVFGAFALASCGGDDSSEPELNHYKFTVEVKDFDTVKQLYPHLSLIYSIPGSGMKTVELTTPTLSVEEKSAASGKIVLTFRGKLDVSKVDPAKKYSLDADVLYYIQINGKTVTSNDNPGFPSISGQDLIDKFSELSETCEYSLP